MGNFKEAIKKSSDDINADLALAKEVTKDFIEILEQSVNSGILRLIALCLSQSNGPLDRYLCAYITLSYFQNIVQQKVMHIILILKVLCQTKLLWLCRTKSQYMYLLRNHEILNFIETFRSHPE